MKNYTSTEEDGIIIIINSLYSFEDDGYHLEFNTLYYWELNQMFKKTIMIIQHVINLVVCLLK
jgi:hypothetical protein